jgi:hypothetical protein
MRLGFQSTKVSHCEPASVALPFTFGGLGGLQKLAFLCDFPRIVVRIIGLSPGKLPAKYVAIKAACGTVLVEKSMGITLP